MCGGESARRAVGAGHRSLMVSYCRRPGNQGPYACPMRAYCREDRHGGPCLRAPHRRSRAAPRHMSRRDGANGTNPRWPLASAILELLPFFVGKRGISMVQAVGLEPTTFRLKGGGSTNEPKLATGASADSSK